MLRIIRAKCNYRKRPISNHDIFYNEFTNSTHYPTCKHHANSIVVNGRLGAFASSSSSSTSFSSSSLNVSKPKLIWNQRYYYSSSHLHSHKSSPFSSSIPASIPASIPTSTEICSNSNSQITNVQSYFISQFYHKYLFQSKTIDKNINIPQTFSSSTTIEQMFQFHNETKTIPNVGDLIFWKCTFTCPITNISISTKFIHEKYQFHLLPGISMGLNKQDGGLGNTNEHHYQHCDKYENQNGEQFYSKKIWAEIACMAHVIDHLPLPIRQEFYNGIRQLGQDNGLVTMDDKYENRTRNGNEEGGGGLMIVDGPICSGGGLNESFLNALSGIDYSTSATNKNNVDNHDYDYDSGFGNNINHNNNISKEDNHKDDKNILLKNSSKNAKQHVQLPPIDELTSMQSTYKGEYGRGGDVVKNIEIIHGQITSLDKNKKKKNGENRSVQNIWTATFTSPISNETFSCGIWKGVSSNDIVIINNDVYYKKKKLARSAAVGRALDCFVHRRGWTNNGDDDFKLPLSDEYLENYQNYCEEDPYDSDSTIVDTVKLFPASSPMIAKEIKNSTLDTKTDTNLVLIDASKTQEIKKFTVDTTTETNLSHSSKSQKAQGTQLPDSSDTSELQATQLMMPKSVIHSRYSALLKKDSIDKVNFLTESIFSQEHKVKYYTCTFECPLTGHYFPAGTLKEISKKMQSDNNPGPPIMMSIGGVVYYRSLKDAEHAAAGRAYDVLSSVNYFSSFGVVEHISMPQFCEEDPHSGFDKDATTRDEASADEDEFVIQYVPQSGMSSTQGSTLLFETMLEDLVDTSNQARRSSFTLKNRDSSLHKDTSILSTDVIKTAMAWCAHMEDEIEHISIKGNRKAHRSKDPKKDDSFRPKSQTFNLLQIPVTLGSCNTILKALGNSNNRPYNSLKYQGNSSQQNQREEEIDTVVGRSDVDSSTLLYQLIQEEIDRTSQDGASDEIDTVSNPGQETDDNTEKIARTIIGLMVAIGKVSTDDKTSILPNVDTFNQYLRCIRRTSPYETALAAESLLNNIIGGESFYETDVRPNAASFNAVIQHYASVPYNGKIHIKILQLFQKLTNESYMKLNKESVLILLQSIARAKEITVFDTSTAAKWIGCLEKYALQHPQVGLNVDVDIYNALLLHQNMNQIKEEHHQIYLNGFRANDNADAIKATDNAKNVEEWLNKMQYIAHENNQVDVFPNTQTFEAIIQAWSKTGTEQGLQRAEYWAERALEAAFSDSDVCPRIETFAPIISAWANSGEEKGVVQVQKWKEVLNDLSVSNPNLRLNANIKAYSIIALHQYQQSLLDDNVALDFHINSMDQRLSVAEACSHELFSILDELKKSDHICPELDATPFQATMDAWRLTFSPMLEEDEIHFRVVEMAKAVSAFSDYLTMGFPISDSSNDKVDGKASQYGEKMFELYKVSALIYFTFMSSIRQKNEVDINTDRYFHFVEKFLRCYEVQCQYFDGLSDDRSLMQVIDMHDEALEWCKSLSRHSQYGDAVRVAMYVLAQSRHLIKNHRIDNNELMRIGMKVVDIIATVTPNDNEKLLLLEKVTADLFTVGIRFDTQYLEQIFTSSNLSTFRTKMMKRRLDLVSTNNN